MIIFSSVSFFTQETKKFVFEIAKKFNFRKLWQYYQKLYEIF